MPGGIQRGLNPVLDKEPAAIVMRLFLTPDHILQVCEALEANCQRIAGEGVKLLDPNDRDIFQLLLIAFLDEVLGHFSAAQHQPLNVLVGCSVGFHRRIRFDPFKLPIAHEFSSRAFRHGMPQK